MKACFFVSILLVYFVRNGCFCAEDAAPKVFISPEKYRLPRSIFPEFYKLNIFTHINDDEGFKFYGDVRIKVNVAENTKNITLHAKHLNISSDEIVVHQLVGDGRRQLSVNKTEFQEEFDFFIVYTNDLLEKDSKYEIYIPFKSDLSKGLLGYYRSSYMDKQSNEKRWIAVTQFEATYARLGFPCFDEPQLKAQFDISLGHHKNFTALSNMPLIASEPIANKSDWVLDKFDVSVPMSTYLVAYTINDFEYKESPADGDVVFRIWARRDAISQVEYAKFVGPQVLKYFEKTFKVKYPLPKMDMIAIPDFSAGAMENWGLITYRETALLFQPNVSSSSSQNYVASVVAHELAHQWFGNLVTMKWWDDLWLNEGFATYVASLGVQNLHPEWNSFQEESLENTVSVFEFDALKSSHPVSVQIGNPNQISAIFDRISYDKGSTIIRMMHLFLGHEVFFNGVSNYLNKYRYKNAEQDNLWEALTEEAHKNEVLEDHITVKQIMDTWTLQTGFPIVNVTRNYKNNSAEVTQHRFLKNPAQPKKLTDNENPCWWVPLSYTTEEELDFNTTEPKTWLECDSSNQPIYKQIIDLPEEDEWVIFNVQIAGLYKIRYDEHNWNLLIKQLSGPEFEKISTLNRAALINDALDLAWNGDQDYSIALKLIKYLKQEKEYLPWRAALSTLSDIARMLRRTSQYGSFKAYIQKIVRPIYLRLGGLNANRNQNDPLDLVKHKVLVSSWACRFDVEDCKEKAIALFSKWMMSENPEKQNPVPLDLRSVVYCTAIRHGSDREWQFLWSRYSKSNVGTEKTLILSALGCSREIWLLQRYLDWTLDETTGVRTQDRATVFKTVARNDAGLLLAKSFLFDHVEEIYKNLQPDTAKISSYVDSVARGMVFTKEYAEFDNFFKAKPEIFTKITRNVEQSLETIRNNNRWQEQNYAKIGRLLSEY